MAKADWGTAAATAIGVLGIGLGFWWADSIVALVISVSIVKVGVTNIKAAVSGLSDARATRYDNSESHPLTEEVEQLARRRETRWRDGLGLASPGAHSRPGAHLPYGNVCRSSI